MPEDICIGFIQKYSDEQKKLEAEIEELEAKLTETENTIQSADDFIRSIKKYLEAPELTREMCYELIDRIIVGGLPKVTGREREIDIVYKVDIASVLRYKLNNTNDKIVCEIERLHMQNRAEAHLIQPGDVFFTSDRKYQVLALRANHTAETTPVFYAIGRGGKRLLYAHDTGVFPEEDYALLKAFGRFGLVSLDCTGCLGIGRSWRDGHMSLKTNLEVMERLRQEGIADEKTIFVANHFSHNGGQTYDEMVPEMAKYGIVVAYDGLEIEFWQCWITPIAVICKKFPPGGGSSLPGIFSSFIFWDKVQLVDGLHFKKYRSAPDRRQYPYAFAGFPAIFVIEKKSKIVSEDEGIGKNEVFKASQSVQTNLAERYNREIKKRQRSTNLST